MAELLTLHQARKIILSHVEPLPHEEILISEGLNRIPSQTLKALLPVPHFRQSTMDGYAVHSSDILSGCIQLPISGEIPAGRTEIQHLPRRQTVRIMTGGAVPPGADQVIPFEHCQESPEQITVFRKGRRWNHIR
jgi:molybdopterin molybdotransferase